MIPILTGLIDDTEGFGRLTDAVECTVTEEKNGAYTLNLIYPMDGELFEDIRAGRLVRARTGDGEQSFDIETTERVLDGLVSVRGVHVSYRLNYIHVRPCTVSADNLQDLLNQLKDNCIEDCPFEFKSSVTWMSSWSYTVSAPTSFRAVIGGIEDSLLAATKTVLRWDNMTVYMEANRNAENGTISVQYGRNITDLDAEDDLDGVYTAVLPYYLDRDGNYVEGTVQRASSADDFPFDRTMLLDLTRQFDSVPGASDLNEAAADYIDSNGIGIADTSVDVDIVTAGGMPDVDGLGIGTPVRIIHNRLGVNTNSEIVESCYDVLHDRYVSLVAGKTRDSLSKVVARQAASSKSSGGSSSVTVSGVAGVKGAAETAFRTGNVSLSAENVGAVPATQAGINDGINLLDTDTQTPVDDDYFISQAVGGGTTDTSYVRRKLSALWAYIKSKADSVYLKLTGGTISGDLSLKSAAIDASTAPSSTTTGKGIYFRDKNNTSLAMLFPYQSTSGRSNIELLARLSIDGATASNELILSVNPDGTKYVNVSDPAAWRSALGITSTGGTGSWTLIGSWVSGGSLSAAFTDYNEILFVYDSKNDDGYSGAASVLIPTANLPSSTYAYFSCLYSTNVQFVVKVNTTNASTYKATYGGSDNTAYKIFCYGR